MSCFSFQKCTRTSQCNFVTRFMCNAWKTSDKTHLRVPLWLILASITGKFCYFFLASRWRKCFMSLGAWENSFCWSIFQTVSFYVYISRFHGGVMSFFLPFPGLRSDSLNGVILFRPPDPREGLFQTGHLLGNSFYLDPLTARSHLLSSLSPSPEFFPVSPLLETKVVVFMTGSVLL